MIIAYDRTHPDNPPELWTDFYPIAEDYELRLMFVFFGYSGSVDVMYEFNPPNKVLNPRTEIDYELWDKAMASMRAQFDAHVARFRIPVASGEVF